MGQSRRSLFMNVGGALIGLLVATILMSASLSAADMGDYRLGSGDKIKIHVFGEDDLTVETLLTDNGAVRYPFLGKMVVSGMTISQLEKLIADGLEGDYLINPFVQVSIIEYRPFFIDGEVKVPGGYAFQPGLTVEKAAALAQGFTERAAKDKIYISRVIGDAQKKVRVDLSTRILPGDIVSVQERFF